jgi:predicted MFS family arabinose efflux permease
MLLAMRFGVGIGEAGGVPPIHSLIGDYYEPERRASAVGIFVMGAPIGQFVGATAGGWLVEHLGWRDVFVIVGMPGILLGILFFLCVREPQRGRTDSGGEAAASARGFGEELSELWMVVKLMFGNWAMLNLVVGVSLTSLAIYGIGLFLAPFFIRVFELKLASVGLTVGLILGIGAGIGALSGGFVGDFASRHGARWYALLSAASVLLAVPACGAGLLGSNWRVVAGLLTIAMAFSYFSFPLVLAVVQNGFGSRRRATAVALLGVVLNTTAIGLGPVLAGWLIDRMAGFYFANPAASSLLSAASAVFTSHPGFRSACPGGLATPQAVRAAMEACRHASALAIRQGLFLTLGFCIWGAAHFFLASFGLERNVMLSKSVGRGEWSTS